MHFPHDDLITFPLDIPLVEEGALISEKIHKGKRDIRVGAGDGGFCLKLSLTIKANVSKRGHAFFCFSTRRITI